MRQTCGLDIKVTLHSVQWAKKMVKVVVYVVDQYRNIFLSLQEDRMCLEG